MPCRPDEEEAQIPEPPNPVTPTKPPRSDRAGHDNSDAAIPLTQSDEKDKERWKQKRKRAMRVLAIYEVVQRWIKFTGDRATQSDEDIEQKNRECETLDAPVRTENFPVTKLWSNSEVLFDIIEQQCLCFY